VLRELADELLTRLAEKQPSERSDDRLWREAAPAK
jgi:hypothetical protein